MQASIDVNKEQNEKLLQSALRDTLRREDSHEFHVCCNGCNREIEFGWSHPDRGGRIWPAECSDFNPWKCWAESRYIEKWKDKDWLRPDKDR